MPETFDELLKLMPAMAKAVNGFTSPEVQRDAFAALLESATGQSPPATDRQGTDDDERERNDGSARRPHRRAAKKAVKKKTGEDGSKKPKRRARGGPSLAKDLDLRPASKKSFRDFATEKAPKTQEEQCVVAVYYLVNTIKVPAVTMNYVYTCFQAAGWRFPSDLANRLSVTASRKAWLDTSDMNDLHVTPQGTNLILHDLPHKPKK